MQDPVNKQVLWRVLGVSLWGELQFIYCSMYTCDYYFNDYLLYNVIFHTGCLGHAFQFLIGN